MSESEKKEFMSLNDTQKDKVFDNKSVLEEFCQDDVRVLRQACQIFRRDFMEIGHIDVFLDPCTMASACNKVLRKRFLTLETIGLIPNGGYSCKKNYSNKALMWILHMQQTEGCKIMHARNSREYRLPELPRFSVEGNCAETRNVDEFLGFFSWLQLSTVSRPKHIRRRHLGRAL
jgi:hypothetical protein